MAQGRGRHLFEVGILKKRKRICAVTGCDTSASTPGVSFFRFPNDPDRVKEWIKGTGRHDLMKKTITYVHQNCRVCGKHFEPKMFLNFLNNRLKEIAVPTIFNFKDVAPAKVVQPEVDDRLVEKMKKIKQRYVEKDHSYYTLKRTSETSTPEDENILKSNCYINRPKNRCINKTLPTKVNHEDYESPNRKDVADVFDNVSSTSEQTPHIIKIRDKPPVVTRMPEGALLLCKIVKPQDKAVTPAPPVVTITDSSTQTPSAFITNTPQMTKMRERVKVLRTLYKKECQKGKRENFQDLCTNLLPVELAQFVITQEKLLKRDQTNGHRYPEELKKFAMRVFFLDPRVYRYLSTIFTLPSERCLRRMREQDRLGELFTEEEFPELYQSAGKPSKRVRRSSPAEEKGENEGNAAVETSCTSSLLYRSLTKGIPKPAQAQIQEAMGIEDDGLVQWELGDVFPLCSPSSTSFH